MKTQDALRDYVHLPFDKESARRYSEVRRHLADAMNPFHHGVQEMPRDRAAPKTALSLSTPRSCQPRIFQVQPPRRFHAPAACSSGRFMRIAAPRDARLAAMRHAGSVQRRTPPPPSAHAPPCNCISFTITPHRLIFQPLATTLTYILLAQVGTWPLPPPPPPLLLPPLLLLSSLLLSSSFIVFVIAWRVSFQ